MNESICSCHAAFPSAVEIIRFTCRIISLCHRSIRPRSLETSLVKTFEAFEPIHSTRTTTWESRKTKTTRTWWWRKKIPKTTKKKINIKRTTSRMTERWVEGFPKTVQKRLRKMTRRSLHRRWRRKFHYESAFLSRWAYKQKKMRRIVCRIFISRRAKDDQKEETETIPLHKCPTKNSISSSREYRIKTKHMEMQVCTKIWAHAPAQ